MELFFFWLLMALVVALVANSKGRSAGLWFFYGLIIWPLALIENGNAKVSHGSGVIISLRAA